MQINANLMLDISKDWLQALVQLIDENKRIQWHWSPDIKVIDCSKFNNLLIFLLNVLFENFFHLSLLLLI